MSDPLLLKRMYNTTKALGESAIVSDAIFEIEGYESMTLHISQFRRPVPTPPDEIEIYGPLGMISKQHVQSNHRQQEPITLIEPIANHISSDLLKLITDSHQSFNAKLHERKRGQIIRTYSLHGCTLCKLNQSEFSYDDRSQVLIIFGVLQFFYFGDVICSDR